MNLEDLYASLAFNQLDYLVILINILTFLASGKLIRWIASNRSEKELKRRIVALRIINLIILSTYLVAGIFDFPLGIKFTQASLVLIVAYGVNHVLQDWILNRFGTERNINGKEVVARTYTSGLIGLLALVLVVSLCFVTLLDIFELEGWIQASSFIGILLFIIYTSKDYLLADAISSLVLHYNHSAEPGSIIRIEELNIFGVVQQITLTQTTIRDLRQGYEITLANSKFRSSVIENLSQTHGNMKDHIELSIHCSAPANTIIDCLRDSWKSVSDNEASLEGTQPSIRMVAQSSSSNVWRMVYTVNNPYKILDIKHLLYIKTLELFNINEVKLSST